MEHTYTHNHHHHHGHSVTLSSVNTAFIIGICLNFLFFVVEVTAGLIIHSLSLLADAGHNLADVGALALSLLAFKLVKVKSSNQFTYGYRKTSVLVALFNAMVLLVSIGAIIYEAVRHFINPQPVQGTAVAVVAAIGIVINSVTALLFFREKKKDINIRSAYMHLLSDAIVSFGIVVGGIIIFYTGWYRIDSILSFVIAAVILVSTWRLLKDSLRLSLDGVPENVDPDKIHAAALKIDGIKDLHHVHIWALSTTENALTAHVVLSSNITVEQEQKIKHELKHELEHNNIQHATLETERENDPCKTEDC